MTVSFTVRPIRGISHTKILPGRTALVLEGGGTRGFFSCGVMDALLEEGILFPYVIGISAGAANALSYLSGQKGRSRQIVEHFVSDPRYISKRNLFRHGSLFGMDFVFREIPSTHIFFDWRVFNDCPARFLTGAVCLEDGKTHWFEKKSVNRTLTTTQASCSIPFLSKVVKIGDKHYLDGGVCDSIPIEKSVADKNIFHLIISTHNAGYYKEERDSRFLTKLFYGKYPKFVEAMSKANESYNRQALLCDKLEMEGKAYVVRPQRPLEVTRTTSDTKKLLDLYDEGIKEGRQAASFLKEKFANDII